MARDEEIFDDLDDEAGDDEYEYEYEEVDEDEAGDEGFEEYEDDFETGPSEAKVKTLPGMDTFALGWSFVATLFAVCLGTWVILYQVYDWRAFDLLPEKEVPVYPTGNIQVLGIGRDSSVSDTANYIVVNVGKRQQVTTGTILWVFPANASDRTAETAILTAIVSEDNEDDVSKAWIVDARSPGARQANAEFISAADFGAIPDTDKARALRNIWLTRGESPEGEPEPLQVRVAPWSEQRIVREQQSRR